MTDEEKKAIKDCDSIFICLDDMMSEDSANDYRKSYKILKNLIEKQQKEIEELKENNKQKYYHVVKSKELEEEINNAWEDKIKAKIEDYDNKGMTVNLVNRSAGKTFQQAVHYEVKKVLQLLLEKE